MGREARRQLPDTVSLETGPQRAWRGVACSVEGGGFVRSRQGPRVGGKPSGGHVLNLLSLEVQACAGERWGLTVQLFWKRGLLGWGAGGCRGDQGRGRGVGSRDLGSRDAAR